MPGLANVSPLAMKRRRSKNNIQNDNDNTYIMDSKEKTCSSSTSAEVSTQGSAATCGEKIELTLEVITAALLMAAKKWINGKLGVARPDQKEGQCCIDHLTKLPRQDEHHPHVALALSKLIDNKVSKHFSQVASHRAWIKHTYQLFSIAKVEDYREELRDLVEIHDLSKYGPNEALGYSIMFGSTGQFRKLEGEEKARWDSAVASHFKNNAHHPQYFGAVPMDEVYLQESLIDMLACRLERVLNGHESLHPAIIMDISPNFLTRYHPTDKVKVEGMIQSWRTALEQLVSSPDQTQATALSQWMKSTGYKLVPQQ